MHNEKKQIENETGVLFAQIQNNPNSPNWKGSFNYNGIIIDLVGWKQISKAGTEYIKIKKDIKKRVETTPEQTDK